MTDRYIRYSETKKFKRCRRAWDLGYRRQLMLPPNPEAPASGKRDVGTLFHAGMEHYYADGGSPVHLIQQRAEEHRLQFGGMTKEWGDTYTLAEIMADGYVQWLASEGMDVGEVTVGVEFGLTVYIGEIYGDRVFLVIHMDRLVYQPEWDQWVIEDLKTVDTLAKDLQFQVDDQLLTYAVVLRRALGITATTARHRMARKVKRTARATPPFYGEVSIGINEDQFSAHWTHLWGLLHDMVSVMQRLESNAANQHLAAYPNPTRDCSWDCDFLPVCANLDDGTNIEPLLNSLYIRRSDLPTGEVHA